MSLLSSIAFKNRPLWQRLRKYLQLRRYQMKIRVITYGRCKFKSFLYGSYLYSRIKQWTGTYIAGSVNNVDFRTNYTVYLK